MTLPAGKKLLFAGVAVTLVFLAAEFFLWIAGVPTVIEREDPFRGFSRLVPVFERDGDRFHTRREEGYRTFNEQSFLAEKPADGLRLFVIGGSSAYGYPWTAEETFSGMLADVLEQAHPQRTVEVVNAAGVSYAMHRLRILSHELLEYDPDVLVIYSGHNEFVETDFFEALKQRGGLNRVEHAAAHSRIYSAMRGLLRPTPTSPATERYDRFVRRETRLWDDEGKRAVVAGFAEGLRDILRRARRAGVTVVLCTVPCNLRDWRPQRSAIDESLAGDMRLRWQRALDEARSRVDAPADHEPDAALAEALALDPTHAESHWLAGRLHEARGEWGLAREAYSRACDLDASPARRLSAINETIRELALAEGALLVDVEQAFVDASEHGLVGFELIEDYVHPTLAGHRIVAWEIWQALERHGNVGAPGTASRATFDEALSRRDGSASHSAGRDNATWLFNQGAVLRNQGHTARAIESFRASLAIAPEFAGALAALADLLIQEQRLDEAEPLVVRLLALDPDSPFGNGLQGTIQLARGEALKAEATFRRLLERNPDDAKGHEGLAVALAVQDRDEEAIAAFRIATELDPEQRDNWYRLAELLRRSDDRQAAADALSRALRLDPGRPRRAVAEFNQLGIAAHTAGQLDEAVRYYQQALAGSPDEPSTLTNLALARQAQGDLGESERLLRRALAAAPDHLEANLNLALLLHRQGRGDEAGPLYRRVLELDPSNDRARRGLATLPPTQE